MCREHLAGALYEYYSEVTLHHSSPSGAYTRSTKGGLASTPSQAVQFAAIEALVDLRYNEVRMQTHPGFYFYLFMHENGRIRFLLLIQRTIVLLATFLAISLPVIS